VLHRRQFERSSAGVFLDACALHHHAAAPAAAADGQGASAKPARRTVTIGGQRVRTVDVHAHVVFQESADLCRGTPLEKKIAHQVKGRMARPVDERRIDELDKMGIDVSAMSVNALWYSADEAFATKLIDMQNRKLAELAGSYPDRFACYASVALQFPELAAKQLDYAVTKLGLCGVAVGGSVEGEELASRRFDPFWAKAEELQALVLIHPQQDAKYLRTQRMDGNGALDNVIGNPLETTYALAHLILEGTFDRFPNLRVCGAHGGGYLPSYPDRMDHAWKVFPKKCASPVLKKKPSEYLKQIFVDTLVFSPEALRHLVAVCGAGQLMIGTDFPVGWVDECIDPILETPGLSDADKIAILGGTATRLLKLDRKS
jgi:aminocarboxymuconate-semialdehyde decarboxylase